MIDHDTYDTLQELAIGYTLLYVEDNKGLREQATKIFKRIFGNVITAENGLEGLKQFKTFKPKLVITDIKMPDMDGLEMTAEIHKISPQTKVIITSAHSDDTTLMRAINTGVFRYLTKPFNMTHFTSVLLEGLKQIKAEDDDRLFTYYITNIFNYQNNLVVMYHKTHPVIANNAFLDFFKVEHLEAFIYQHGSLGNHFLPHEDFLYDHNAQQWFTEALKNINHLYHVIMKDPEDAVHHFVFKMVAIEGKSDYYIVTLDDITELGLLPLFDKHLANAVPLHQDQQTILKLLETAQKNRAQIRMQNLYKGLSIANKGSLTTVSKRKVELQSGYLQQKGAQHEGRLILSNELFPYDILCRHIKAVNFEHQTIEVDDLIFMRTSPCMRQSIRLQPDERHSATLLFEGHKFGEGVTVDDISLEAVKLSLFSLPAGLSIDTIAQVDMVFHLGQHLIIINTEAQVYAIRERKDAFEVVFMLHLSPDNRSLLVDYLAHRQVELVREFKGLDHEHHTTAPHRHGKRSLA